MNRRGAIRDEQARIEAAEDEAEMRGILRGVALVADWLERKGQGELAKELRAMKVKTE